LAELFIGLMSGTSLDGVDAVLADFSANPPRLVGTNHEPFDGDLRRRLTSLLEPGHDELRRAAELANALAMRYADAALELLAEAGVEPTAVAAIGCHGQTVRHRPDLGFTLQLGNAALLAEATGISVISDFRSRDIAAGGEGAPLVPGFHATVFRSPREHRAVLNLGGIANITNLPPVGSVSGFDCGPGNTLLDGWCTRHRGKAFDEDGAWADSGRVLHDVLDRLLADPFFRRPPPKSTGREAFNLTWLEGCLQGVESPADVQATLLALSARSVGQSLRDWCPGVQSVYVCGGGARNGALVRALAGSLPGIAVRLTDELGIPAEWVEAFAFAWLARQGLRGEPGNVPAVTGARGPRVLGAIYRA